MLERSPSLVCLLGSVSLIAIRSKKDPKLISNREQRDFVRLGEKGAIALIRIFYLYPLNYR